MAEGDSNLNFKKIEFGKADALNEKGLLVDGFLDVYGYIEKIIDGDKYFVVGQKGSGKSAIASKLKIISEKEHNIEVNIQMLDDFDYDGFTGVIPGKDTPEIRYANTWEFLIALKLIEMYSESEYNLEDKSADPKELVKALKKLGILPNTLKTVIHKFKLKDLKVDAKVAQFTISHNKIENRDIKRIIESTVSLFYKISPIKKHFIIMDGLDSVLSKRGNQYEVLSSLIRSVNQINHKLSYLGIQSRVVVLCRKDVLDKLNDPNRSKYIQDSGIELNWFQTVNDIKESDLYKLINLRAKNSLKHDVDVMEQFLPAKLYDRETFRYLLDNTRYTPRDVIQLMNRIQSVSPARGASLANIKDGINAYSDGYFLMEIKDSLVGMLSNDDIEDAFKAIRTMGKLEFSYKEFSEAVGGESKAYPMLSALYIAGAVSNLEKDEDGKSYRVSVIRNPNSLFNEKKMISVNMGLKKALMLH